MLVKEEDRGKANRNLKKRVKERKELARTSLLLKIQKYDAGKDTTVKGSARDIVDHPVTKMYIHKRWDEKNEVFRKPKIAKSIMLGVNA